LPEKVCDEHDDDDDDDDDDCGGGVNNLVVLIEIYLHAVSFPRASFQRQHKLCAGDISNA
jgi:hypothetical protein